LPRETASILLGEALGPMNDHPQISGSDTAGYSACTIGARNARHDNPLASPVTNVQQLRRPCPAETTALD
jgi:hypothetical protein